MLIHFIRVKNQLADGLAGYICLTRQRGPWCAHFEVNGLIRGLAALAGIRHRRLGPAGLRQGLHGHEEAGAPSPSHALPRRFARRSCAVRTVCAVKHSLRTLAQRTRVQSVKTNIY
jgi:hypothetical protein